ncbi:MAG: hypothetical protein LC774_17570 [Acidobacteria bacterium]|nr:hypothetical protein [Acidobacteriota bacterium]
MSDAAQTKSLELERDRARRLELTAEYVPDDAAQARALLLIAGVPEDEIERVVTEMSLESDREM